MNALVCAYGLTRTLPHCPQSLAELLVLVVGGWPVEGGHSVRLLAYIPHRLQYS